MAVFDTHRAIKTLTAAGFSEAKAEAMLDAMGDSHDALATKADLRELAQANRADLNELAQTTKADLNELAQTTKADLNELAQATKADLRELAQTTASDLRELELRMRLHLGAYVFAAAGLVIAVLLAIELLPR